MTYYDSYVERYPGYRTFPHEYGPLGKLESHEIAMSRVASAWPVSARWSALWSLLREVRIEHGPRRNAEMAQRLTPFSLRIKRTTVRLCVPNSMYVLMEGSPEARLWQWLFV